MKFIDYFCPSLGEHLEWVNHLRKFQCWPQEMFTVLDERGIEYPEVTDSIGSMLVIAEYFLQKFEDGELDF